MLYQLLGPKPIENNVNENKIARHIHINCYCLQAHRFECLSWLMQTIEPNFREVVSFNKKHTLRFGEMLFKVGIPNEFLFLIQKYVRTKTLTIYFDKIYEKIKYIHCCMHEVLLIDVRLSNNHDRGRSHTVGHTVTSVEYKPLLIDCHF